MTLHFPSDEDKAFEKYLEAVEGTGPQTTLVALLEKARIPLPLPEDLSDSDLAAILWRVIQGMAEVGAFLHSTDHLSDRELYVVLWNNILPEEYPIVPAEIPMRCEIDILGGWSNEDRQTWLTYYADEKERREESESGTVPIPEHIDPPYRRDHLLPR